MGDQDNGQIAILQRPTTDNRDEWKAYWQAQGQPWRTEAEIDTKRQEELAQRRAIIPDTKEGIYPFRGVKLGRADIEWLLATHENGRGPVDWSDESQRGRQGLNLRGADLRFENLQDLPLTNLDGCMISATPLRTNFEGAFLGRAHLEGSDLRDANLKGAHLNGASLEEARIFRAYLEEADLQGAHLKRVSFGGAFLSGANLSGANLTDAILSRADLSRADLSEAHLEGADLSGAHLEGANLNASFFDNKTKLKDAVLFNEKLGGVSLADVRWNDVNGAMIDWSALIMLGDEHTADQARQQYDFYMRYDYNEYDDGEQRYRRIRLDAQQTAVRSYRQLSVVLRNHGLNEDAARFAYRAQMLQRKVFWYQAIGEIMEHDDNNSLLLHQFVSRLQSGIPKFGQYLFSLLLDLLAGYGYKPWRSFVAYLLVITAFATAYFIIGQHIGPALSPLGSVVFSMTSFHGRGFFPGGITLDDPLTVLAALEAFVGLLIEVTFIATLTQRLFGK